jgi:hypothetical protein
MVHLECVHFRINVESVVEFRVACEDASDLFRKSPHCLSFELSPMSSDLDSYVLRIEWASRMESPLRLTSSSEFQQLLTHLQPTIKAITLF